MACSWPRSWPNEPVPLLSVRITSIYPSPKMSLDCALGKEATYPDFPDGLSRKPACKTKWEAFQEALLLGRLPGVEGRRAGNEVGQCTNGHQGRMQPGSGGGMMWAHPEGG